MNIDRAIFHPDYVREPWWWQAARPATTHATQLPAASEVLIVGSGYAGLSAALELARSARSVVVVDALAFGEGASTRNGGGVSAGVNLGKGLAGGPGQAQSHAEREQRMHALMKESLAAYELVGELIERERIECHYEERGRFVGAWSAAHFAGLAAKAEALNSTLQLRASVVPAAQQRSEIGSDFYHGGMVVERAAKLHPALYHRGLLDACQRAGVRLCAHTRVDAVRRTSRPFVVKTSRGDCRAEHVVIATNGYTGELTPGLRDRIVPIASQIIMTEELPEELTRQLIPNGRTISETPRVTSYYRLAPGNRRVMYGGRARFQQVPADVSAALLHRMMVARWPQLAGVRITHSWSGLVAMTRDSLPHMGVEQGMHWCTGCNGSGVAMMTYLGQQVARRIVHGARADSVWEQLDFPGIPVPGYRGRPWFLPLVGEYYRWLDRKDRGRRA